MRIPGTGKLNNEEVIQRAGRERNLIGEIRTKQMRFLGQVFRKDGLKFCTDREDRGVEEENGRFG